MAKILAIDPGNELSAYVEYDSDLKKVMAKRKVKNEELLKFIARFSWHSWTMAIEMPACYGMAVGGTVMHTCRWVGRFQDRFESKGGLCYLVYRKAQNKEDNIESVTMHLCKSTRAKDSNVRQAIIDLYGGEERAIGGKKCPKCKGKGWFGPGRPECPECNGEKWKTPPGPLHGVTADVWAALAVAITFSETYHELT